VVSAESCQLHRCHLACLATWLDSAPSGRAGRCPGLGCGASLAKLRIRRPGNEEIVESARLQVSCPICLEQLSGPVATPDTCPGHQFCPPCLRAWTGQSRLCPYDRRPFGSIHLRLGVASDIVTNDEPLPELPAAVADPTAADAATDTGISDDEVNNDFGNDEDDDDDEDDSDSGSDGGQIDQAFGFADLFEFEEGEFEAQEAQVDLQPQALPFVQIDTNTFETDSDVEAGVDSNSEDAENSHVDNFNGNAHGDDVDANANSHYHDADSHLDVANTDSHGDDAYVDADFHDLDADAQLNDANADSHGDDSFADADYHSDDIYADADSRDVNDYSQLDDVNADNADSHADANFHFDYVDADADSDD
uniref:RING-type domain-containing protein n=2 Tax=Macrostomum lignano TaxID=282301 RepID=A0A1I8HMP3_9PLAT